MPVPASKLIPSDALPNTAKLMLQMRTQALAFSARLAAGNVSAQEIIDNVPRLKGFREAFVDTSEIPGIAAYAQEAFDDPTLDLSVEFPAMLAAIDAVVTWINTNIPKDAGGYWLITSGAVDAPVSRTFTPAQTAQLRTRLNTLAATVT